MSDGMAWRVEKIQRTITEIIYSREVSNREAIVPLVETYLYKLSISMTWSECERESESAGIDLLPIGF